MWPQWLKALSSVNISPVSGCSPATIPQLLSLGCGPDAICLLSKGFWDAQMRKAEEVAGIADTPPNTHTLAPCHWEERVKGISWQLWAGLEPLTHLQAKEWKGRATYFEPLMMRLLFWWFLSQLHLGILSHPVDLFPGVKKKAREKELCNWERVTFCTYSDKRFRLFLWELGAWTQSPDLRDSAFKCGNYCPVCSNRITEKQLRKVLRGQLCSGPSKEMSAQLAVLSQWH